MNLTTTLNLLTRKAFLFSCFALIILIAHCSLSQALTIKSQIEDGAWKEIPAVYPTKGQKVRLRVRAPLGTTIRWFRIIPDIAKFYHNAQWPWNPGAYQWLGYEKIQYHKCEMISFRNYPEIDPLAMDSQSLNCATEIPESPYYHADVGSFWYQVEIDQMGKIDKSPGLEGSDEKGMSPKVFRISIRDGEEYLGYLTSFFNVPAVFGSTLCQSQHHIGVDCADAIMAAYYLWKGEETDRDDNVQSVVARFPTLVRFNINQGVPDRKILWTKTVRPGDFIAVKYLGSRSYQHIGALYKDENGDGVLDSGDVVLHAGPEPLHFSPLSEGAFDGSVVILRPEE
ncbi:MAG: hypothetical protein HY399_03380 [Elusimicrobia bacterium]|nr:hypothetical protein [Elusimicrobiota bacterium]